jgi:putative membrane protein
MRRVLLALGLASLASVWLLPVERLVPGPFSAHMIVHMGVVAVAAPLISLGLAGGRLDPVRACPARFPPVPLAMLELVEVWSWHTPALHHAARASSLARGLEQGLFLACGLLVWLAAFGGRPAGRAGRGAAGIVALLLTSMHMTLLGALLALPARPLYAIHAGGAPGLSPLEDQHLGGAIMLLVGGVSYLAGGLVLTRAILVSREKAPSSQSVRPALLRPDGER